jgi:hypothetical protein
MNKMRRRRGTGRHRAMTMKKRRVMCKRAAGKMTTSQVKHKMMMTMRMMMMRVRSS